MPTLTRNWILFMYKIKETKKEVLEGGFNPSAMGSVIYKYFKSYVAHGLWNPSKNKKNEKRDWKGRNTQLLDWKSESLGKKNRFPSFLFVCSFHWLYPLNQRIHHLIFSIHISHCLFYFPPKNVVLQDSQQFFLINIDVRAILHVFWWIL